MAFFDTPKKDDVAKGKSTDKITGAQKKGAKEKTVTPKDVQTKGKKGGDKEIPPSAAPRPK
jgi:hypothetical protein